MTDEGARSMFIWRQLGVRTYLTAGLLLALVAFAGTAWWYRSEAKGLRVELGASEAKVEAYAEAAALRAEADREQERLREEAAALDHDLNTMEGADAPLSDYLRDGAGRVWR